MSEKQDNSDYDLEKILEAYQKDNEQLHLRNKELEKQIASNDTDVRKENESLRRQILELKGNQISSENYQQLQDEHVQYVRDTKQRILSLEEEIEILKIENEKLKSSMTRWDQDETRNSSIESVINSLKTAFIHGKGIEQAFDNLAAIICPEILVRREKEVNELRSNAKNKFGKYPGRHDIQTSSEIKRLKEEIEQLKEQVENLKKAKSQPKKTGIPGRLSSATNAAVMSSAKVKELEAQVAEYQQKNDELQREIANIKGRSKDRTTKVKDLQNQINKLQQDLLEEQRKHQIDVNNYTVEKASYETQIKALQTNTDFRSEMEKYKARVQILEAENTELKKPRPTGNAALDKVLDTMARMEGDIKQRQMDLNRMALKLEDKFEEERRLLENSHKKEIDEKNQQLRRLKREFEAILADLEKRKSAKRKVQQPPTM